MNKNLVITLAFLVLLMIIFWLMPNKKIDIIGDFFEKIIKPLGIPLSTMISISLGIIKYKQFKNKDSL